MKELGSAVRPSVIVLTPVRNEAWILPTFLACAALWADRIIVADQGSDDGSRAIAAAHPKVAVIDNPERRFGEGERQRLLIDAARQVPGPRLLVALDADELLSANLLGSREWEMALMAPAGTSIELAKVELYGSPHQYILHTGADHGQSFPFAYVDDGAPHDGRVIHTCRVPQPRGERRRLRLKSIVVLHYQLLARARQASKGRWYRCFERITCPDKSVVEIERQHGWVARTDLPRARRACPPEWLAGYRARGIDVEPRGDDDADFWWDWDILRMMREHGIAPFRYLDIWDVDWEAKRREGLRRGIVGLPETPIVAPRTPIDRAVRAALRRSHRFHPRRWFDPLLHELTRFPG